MKIIENPWENQHFRNANDKKNLTISMKYWETLGKTTFCDLVINLGCAVRTLGSLESSGEPLGNVRKPIHLQRASQVSGNGYLKSLQNLMVSRKHWKSL